MRPDLIAILAIFIFFALAEFFRTGLFHKPRQRRKDAIVEVVGDLRRPFRCVLGQASLQDQVIVMVDVARRKNDIDAINTLGTSR